MRQNHDDLLLIRPGAIGDALLLAPSLAALRSCRSDLTVTLVAHPAVGDLLREQRLIDRFVSRDAPAADALFAPSLALAQVHWAGVGAAVAWSADPDGRLATNLAALGAAPLLVVPSRPDEDSSLHVAQYLLDTLTLLGVRGDATAFSGFARPDLRQPELSSRCPLDRPYAVFHPGSGSPRKNWPTERFAELADRLVEQTGWRVLALGGPADADTLAAFERASGRRHSLLLDYPIPLLAALLTRSALYVGNDSGVSHLAGLSGARVLALFGPTSPERWRPLGPRVRVLRHQPLSELPLPRVLEAALALVAQD